MPLAAKKPSNGAILWEGLSELNGAPIVVIATGLRRPSANPKTGPMVQVWILPRDVNPHRATRSGEDASVCGDCPLRYQASVARGSGDAVCYVRTSDAPSAVWKTYQAGKYPRGRLGLLAGRRVRLGAYGDPAAVPFEVWVDHLEGARGWTGYTHQWRTCDPRLAGLVMASCDSPLDAARARWSGWRTFRGKLAEEPAYRGEVVCPATEEGGMRSSCDRCLLCDGSSGLMDKRASITITVHGHNGKVRGYETLRVVQ